MIELFSDYAKYYDLFYENKNYDRESLFVHNLIRNYSSNCSERLLLDMGCGTGKHLINFANFGYSVSGSDLSLEMINNAKQRAISHGKEIFFYNESFQTCSRIGSKFNVITGMFSCINYIISEEELTKSFQNILSLLKTKGLLIFDFWNAPAVVKNFSPFKEKRVSSQNYSILRKSETALNESDNTAEVTFKFDVFEKKKLIKSFNEKHLLRYHHPENLISLLKKVGFKIELLCPFMQPKKVLGDNCWNATIVARKTE